MTTKWIFIIIIYIAINTEIYLIQSQQFPCLFLFGDSLLDNGNNNGLITLAKANYPPYGIDYPEGPTGRFSDGDNIGDSFAKLLGFVDPIPPFATARGSQILRGVNYASAVGGILDETGIQVGQRISVDRQLQNHRKTIGQFSDLLGNQTAADRRLRQCMYVVNVANEDYVNNYYFPLSPTPVLYSPAQFAQLLNRRLSEQLRTLYGLGSRKVVVFGLTTLGCIPEELGRFPTNGSPCVDFINDAVGLYNNGLASLINDLNSDLSEAQFTFVNITDLSSANPSATGTTENKVACCEVNLIGLCGRNGRACTNRSAYYYYDNYHPTEFVYNLFAARAYQAITN